MEAIQPPQESTSQPQEGEAPILTSQVPDLTHMSLGEIETIRPEVMLEIGAYTLQQVQKPIATVAGSSGS
jgi:hypothetical protein